MALSQHLTAGTEKNHEKPSVKDNRFSGRDLNPDLSNTKQNF
jgi:hypothetical protein